MWRFFFAVVCVCLLSLAPSPIVALEIRQVIWGFDGKIVPGRFNMLSVMIDNTDSESFDGTLRLNRQRNHTGANLDEPIYLAPFASRWVHFYPYMFQYDSSWTLSWGRKADQSFDLPIPQQGKPARIFLEDSESFSIEPTGLKSLPSHLFPPRATATDSLALVILDHSPRWEPARRRAFHDWIVRGGKVHLLLDKNGRFPEFPADLNELNAPLEKSRLGSGMIFRHEKSRSGMNSSELPAISHSQSPSHAIEGESPPEIVAQQRANRQSRLSLSDTDGSIFNRLRAMTRPDHNWIVIHTMSIIYLLLIFPGCYLLGRKRGDYRVTFTVLLGIVLLFSFAFSIVGKRGYEETTAANSVALARSLGDGQFDVTQWTNVFVTRGDDYLISHLGSGKIYSTCQQNERVNGIIRNSSGSFLVDIPPYSSRTFVHRSKLKSKTLDVTINRWQAEESLRQLELTTDDFFPETPRKAYVHYRDKFYSLTVDGNRFSFGSYLFDVSNFANHLNDSSGGHWNWRGRINEFSDMSSEQIYRDTANPLLLRYLTSWTADNSQQQTLTRDHIKLFIYAPMPADFFLTNERLGKNAGYVLYIVDLFQAENT